MTADEASPTARGLRTLELLQRHPGLTSADLAARLGVSDRAARRYVAILREAGISVDSTPGRYGGYRLGRGLRLPPLVFSSTEALGLVMAVLDGQHAAADAGTPVGAALGKIIAALPPDVGRQAALLREHALTAPERHAVRPDPTTTSRLVEAVAERRQVRLGYRPRSGPARTGVVDPWAVVVRGGLWYLLGHAHGPDAPRTYRVDRVGDVEVLDAGCTPPADLDAVAWLERHLGTGRAYRTRVRFAAPLADVAPWVSAAMGDLEALDDGSCRLSGTTDNPAMYANEWLAAVPHPCTVEGGPELRDAVAALARRLTASLT
ncbi:Predicted DNA-binding transcriptional regulator YafY, contains an HTH and WYL domains [Friedmanniella luteola]|uniref:Predicted DNA-binding transcriptional regulator YafY, contains an HTH and WYL domains n=1 Tax=Friedmanniella luteola TaxID=546871 RepID=A0A1H1UZD0_9ACTN|nr:WYL domain-containing protein [Friedmanniella luteola]SDS77877.1 Predicted DNA-binding transcriptional regulator YafY, contains an HTH and WYL domains [Friedmanniella luteola]